MVVDNTGVVKLGSVEVNVLKVGIVGIVEVDVLVEDVGKLVVVEVEIDVLVADVVELGAVGLDIQAVNNKIAKDASVTISNFIFI